MRTLFRYIALLYSVSLAVASSALAEPSVIDGQWRLVSALGVKVPDGASLTFADGKLSGSTGCNRFFGPFVVKDKSFKSGPISATRIYCHERRHIDRTVLVALETVTVFEQTGDRLVMHYEPGDKMLEFTK